MLKIENDAIIIPTKYLEQFFEFSSSDATRSNITGLGLSVSEKDGNVFRVRMAATDDHTLACVEVTPPSRETRHENMRHASYFPGEYVDKKIRLAKAEKLENVALELSALTQEYGHFPEFEQVFPKEPTFTQGDVFLDAYYLERLAKLGKVFNKKSQAVKILNIEKEGPAWFLIQSPELPPTHVLIMPLRGDF